MDQPGIAAHPFNNMPPEYKGTDLRSETELMINKLGEKATKSYYETFTNFCSSNIDATKFKPNQGWKTKVDIKNSIKNSIKNGEPFFALNLNKIIGWTPINLSGKRPKNTDLTDFVKHRTYFDCTAVDNRVGKSAGCTAVPLQKCSAVQCWTDLHWSCTAV